MDPHPNPVIAAIDDGHTRTVTKDVEICRKDREPWKCSTILRAESVARERNQQTERERRRNPGKGLIGNLGR